VWLIPASNLPLSVGRSQPVDARARSGRDCLVWLITLRSERLQAEL